MDGVTHRTGKGEQHLPHLYFTFEFLSRMAQLLMQQLGRGIRN